tara:strand:- start:2489 stop:2653 length:165 start_codon:yes stop_codon:yes gene_type:complete
MSDNIKIKDGDGANKYQQVNGTGVSTGDMFIFTLHRENGLASNGGVTYEFAEEI